MTWLSDGAVGRLQVLTDTPDTTATRYRIVATIGRGGMGVIYEADDLTLGRRVALKVLAHEAAERDAAQRLRAEAGTIAQLEHPGIAPIYDAGVLPDGRVFYAMKLVRGKRLDEVTASTNEIVRTLVRICEAVGFAHARGVVHCDLKPENVMLGEFGEVFVMDWGVSRAVGERAIAGTVDFMSPEQSRGEPVDPTTDVYAIGAMLRHAIALKPLRAIAAKATNPQPGDRYPDARSLAAELLRYLDNEMLEAYRPPLIERAARWVVRNRALLSIIAAYLAMRVIILLFVHR